MAIYSSILARKIPWTEELHGLQPIGVTKSQTQLSDCAYTHTHTHTRNTFFTHSSVHGHLGCFHYWLL